jgi:hypothetical protein
MCPQPRCVLVNKPQIVDRPDGITMGMEHYRGLCQLYDHGTFQYELDLQALEFFTRSELLFEQNMISQSVLLLSPSFIVREEQKEDLLSIQNYSRLMGIDIPYAKACGFAMETLGTQLGFDIFKDGTYRRIADIFAYGQSGWERAQSDGPLRKTKRLCYNPQMLKLKLSFSIMLKLIILKLSFAVPGRTVRYS